jgi:hypothetical protein
MLAAKHEALVQQALKGIANQTYKFTYEAAKKLGVPSRALYNCIKSGKSQSQTCEAQQYLLESEEQELAQWIGNLTVSGTPAQYSIV